MGGALQTEEVELSEVVLPTLLGGCKSCGPWLEAVDMTGMPLGPELLFLTPAFPVKFRQRVSFVL